MALFDPTMLATTRTLRKWTAKTANMPTVPPEQQASYSAIIDQILASSDLNTISAKRIRKGLQEKVDYDITPQKVGTCDQIDSAIKLVIP